MMRAVVRHRQAERITAETADVVIVAAGTDRETADRQLDALSDEHPDCALFLDYTGRARRSTRSGAPAHSTSRM